MIFFLITGASRGIGRAVVKELDSLYGEGAAYLLVARNEAALRSLKGEIKGESQILAADLGQPVSTAQTVAEILSEINASKYERLVLINNAGILAPVGKIGTLMNDELEEIIQVNLTTPMVLMNIFLRWADKSSNPKLIVNVSSGAARFPIVSWGGYCASKAGLDMFSRAIAEEKRPDLRVISVAPGIIETDMQRSIRDLTPDQFPLVDTFANYKATGSLKSPEQTAEEIVKIIENPSDFEVIASL